MPIALRFARILHSTVPSASTAELSKQTIDAIAHEVSTTIERDIAIQLQRIFGTLLFWFFVVSFILSLSRYCANLCRRADRILVAREYNQEQAEYEHEGSLEDKSYPTRIPTHL